MDSLSKRNSKYKEKIVHEVKRFIVYTFFLTLLFGTFTAYQRLILNDFSNKYIPYGYCIIESLILAKVILIGEAFKLGMRYSHKPLIFPVLHKTILFSLVVLVMSVVEDMINRLMSGKSIELVYQEFTSLGYKQIIAKMILMFFIFILFFSFLEMGRVIGENRLINLFFRRKDNNPI